MNKKVFKKYLCQKDNARYEIDEDLVGWYLIAYPDLHTTQSSEDYLLDSLDDAFVEAEYRYNISRTLWKEHKN